MHILMMMSGLAMGGGEYSVLSLIPCLRECGHKVSLLTLNKRRDSALAQLIEEESIHRIDLGAKRMLDRRAWKRFADILRKGDFDIIHPQDQDTIIYGALAHRQIGIPSVMTRHVMNEPQNTIKEWFRARLLLLAARYGYDHVVTVSEAVRLHFHKLTGIPLKQIRTIHNGLAFERFNHKPQKVLIRKQLGWAVDNPIMVMIAVLRPGKGHELLFAAIPKILEKHPDVKIKIIGGGELEQELREKGSGYENVVEFMGQRSDIPQLLGASDLLVLPSWSEALPNVLIEAGAAGLPVVATDVGGTRDIVTDGETGYVIPAGDSEKLAEKSSLLLGNKEKAEEMGKRAEKRIRQMFTLQRQASALTSLYKEILIQT